LVAHNASPLYKRYFQAKTTPIGDPAKRGTEVKRRRGERYCIKAGSIVETGTSRRFSKSEEGRGRDNKEVSAVLASPKGNIGWGKKVVRETALFARKWESIAPTGRSLVRA